MIPSNITIHALLEIVPVAIQSGQFVWAATCPMVGVVSLYIVVSVRAWMWTSSVSISHGKKMFFHWTFLWYWKAGTIVQLTDYYYKVHTHTHHSFYSRRNTHHFPQTLTISHEHSQPQRELIEGQITCYITQPTQILLGTYPPGSSEKGMKMDLTIRMCVFIF